MESYEVYWKGKLVGELVEATSDMWYLEGTWRSSPLREAADFAVRAEGLDPKRVMKDPVAGIRAQVRSLEAGVTEMTDALVLSLYAGRLLVRRVVVAKAVQWLRENVPE